MRGSYRVRVENARVQFKITVNRSITVIRGSSATGKSTLVSMIAEYEQEGPASGITLSCERPCTVLSGRSWQRDLHDIHESIIFIDEGSGFLRSEEFARAIRDSDNYYVIISRENLPMLPYSVEEIYELRNTTSHYPGIKKYYTHTQRMYAQNDESAGR